MQKDYIERFEGAERRFYNPQIQLKSEDDQSTGMIEGVAAVIGKSTDMGWYDEIIERGAFDDVLQDDVVALFNHDPNFPLARTTANGDGKLELYISKSGDLAYRFKAPNTTAGNDLKENIRSQIVSKSSFAFTIAEEEWQWASEKEKRDKDVRVIKKISRLYDVSPVTYPAYNDTSVAERSMQSNHKPQVNLTEHKRRLFKLKFKTND